MSIIVPMGGNAPPQGLNIGYQLTIYNLYYDVHRFPSGPSNLSLACIGCIGARSLLLHILSAFQRPSGLKSICSRCLFLNKWALNPIPNLLIPRCLWLNNRLNHLLQLLNLLLVSDLNTNNIRSELIAE